MSIDSRVRRILLALEQSGPASPAHKIINPNVGPTPVVSSILRHAQREGLAESTMIKSIRHWTITDAGRVAIHQ